MGKFVVGCFDQHASERRNADSAREKDHSLGVVLRQGESSEWTFNVNPCPQRYFPQHAFKGGVPKTRGDHELLFGRSVGQGKGSCMALRIRI